VSSQHSEVAAPVERQIPEVEIYTDGACSGNPGPGGWSAILRCRGAESSYSGGEEHTTSSRMELNAVIEALKVLDRPCKVALHADSAYVVNAFEKDWISGWLRRGWLKAGGKEEVANQDLWKELLSLTGWGDEIVGVHDVRFVKVAGHAGVDLNERCDRLAVEQRDRFKAIVAERLRAARSAA
jgi:ribonuclease HI